MPLFSFLRRPSARAALVSSPIPGAAPADAALYMAVAMVAFSTMGMFIRLAAAELPVLEVVFFRNIFAVLLLSPLLLRHGFGMLRTTRFRLHLTRNVIGAAAMAAGFAGVTMIPLATSTALGFTAPLFTTIGAVLILGERVRVHRISALAAGFIGVMIVLDPGALLRAGAPALGAALALGSSVLIGASALMLKSLTSSDKPATIAFWMVLLQAPISLVAALFVWQWPSAVTLFWMLCLAGAGTIGHLFWTRACALAEMTELQPYEFLKLPLSAGLGWLVFSQAPAGSVWLGGAVIFLATAYITHREHLLGRPRRAPRRNIE